MAEEVAIDLNIKTGEAEKNTQSLKSKLKELKQQLAGLEEGSDAFNKIAKEAGEVQDKIGDLNQRVKNLASDTRKLDVVVGVAQGIAGGFAAATGAAALFGVESEDLNKTLLKVQSSLALLNGVQQIANTLNKDSAVMTNLNSSAQAAYTFVVGTSTGALKLFRIALASTGIGLVVIAIGALIANWDRLTGSINESAKATDEDTAATKRNQEAQQQLVKALDHVSDIREGKNKELLDKTRQINQEIEQLEREAAKIKAEIDKNTNAEVLKNLGIAHADTLAKIDTLNAEKDRLVKEAADKEAAIQKEQNKKIDEEKKAADEKDLDDRVAHLREINAAKQANVEALKAAEIKLAEEDLAMKKYYDEQDLARRTELDGKVEELREKDKQAAIKAQEEIDAKKKQSTQDAFNLTQQSLAATQGLSDIFYQNQLNQAAGNDKKTREIKKKQFETNKVFTVSSIVLDTVLGMIKALSQAPGPVGIAEAAIMGIAGTAATIKALATKFDSGSTGTLSLPSSGSSNTGNTPATNSAPQIPQTPSSIPIPQQVYVTETDISGVQGQVNVIEGLAKIH